MTPVVSETPVKKLAAMIEESVPKMKKSYHSKAVPAEEAIITVRSCCAVGSKPVGAGPSVLPSA